MRVAGRVVEVSARARISSPVRLAPFAGFDVRGIAQNSEIFIVAGGTIWIFMCTDQHEALLI